MRVVFLRGACIFAPPSPCCVRACRRGGACAGTYARVCMCVRAGMYAGVCRQASRCVCVCVFVRMRAGCAGVYGGGCVSVCVYVCLCVWVGWKGLEHCAKYFNYTEIICGLPIRCVVHSNPSACQIYDNIKIFFICCPFLLLPKFAHIYLVINMPSVHCSYLQSNLIHELS